MQHDSLTLIIAAPIGGAWRIIMKARLFVFALALGSVAGLSHAAEVSTVAVAPAPMALSVSSTPMDEQMASKTRHEVYQELVASRSSGEFQHLRAQYRGR
jgi:hypothetical protein